MSQNITSSTIQQSAAKTAAPPLPPLPYLQDNPLPVAPRAQESAPQPPGSLDKEVTSVIAQKLPEQFKQCPDIQAIVRQAVIDAVQAYSQGQGAAAYGAAPHCAASQGTAPATDQKAKNSCAACGVCTGPAVIGPSASEAGRTHAGSVVAMDATQLNFGRFPGAPDSIVNIVDVITPRDGSPMGGGYLQWNALSFPWRLTYAEVDVVLEGELHITSGGQTVVGKPGDMLFIPKDTDVIFSSPGHVRFAYVTWPAEWSATLDQVGGGS